MRALFFGGSGFVGRHLVEAWLADGHEATLFNRGRSDPAAFPEVERITGDRDGDLSALTKRAWDVVFDTSGYLPSSVRASVAVKGDARYVFVSSISVYSDLSNTDEVKGPTHAPMDGELSLATYGPLKVACEQALPEDALIARAGLIEGPHDYDARMRWWLERMAKGGDVIAPGDPDALVQFIDVRDLGGWLAKSTALSGVFNATGPAEPITMRALLEGMHEIVGSDAKLVWVPDDVLLAKNVIPYAELPFWLPSSLGAKPVPNARAREAGLTFRPWPQTVQDAWNWMKKSWDSAASVRENRTLRVPAGISPERERDILDR